MVHDQSGTGVLTEPAVRAALLMWAQQELS